MIVNILYELGIDDKEIKIMLEQVPSIIDMSYEEINKKIDILRYIDCSFRHIKNIIVSNPYYFDLLDDDVLKLIRYFKKIGVSNINLLFDSNPFILNKEVFEIKDYVSKRIDFGMSLEDIVDEIECNPYIIDED